MLLTDAERRKKGVDGREENEKISVNCEKSWWKRKYFNKVRIYIYIFILRWLVGITISDYETSKDINGLGPNPSYTSYDPNIFDKKNYAATLHAPLGTYQLPRVVLLLTLC